MPVSCADLSAYATELKSSMSLASGVGVDLIDVYFTPDCTVTWTIHAPARTYDGAFDDILTNIIKYHRG